MRALKFMLACVLVFSAAPAAAFAESAEVLADLAKAIQTNVRNLAPADDAEPAVGDVFEYEGINYCITSVDEVYEVAVGQFIPDDSDNWNDTKTESAPGENWQGGDIVIPETVEYEGLSFTVTAIDACAFYKNATLTSLEVPSTVKSIGDYAFSGSYNIKTLTLHEGLETIGNYALAIGTTTTNTAVTAGQSSIVELTIPSTVTSIGNYGFGYLRYLETLTFVDTEENPSQLTSIGGGAFACCPTSTLYYNKVLTEVTIPSSVTSMGSAIFAYCAALETVVFECDTSAMSYKATSSSSSTAWFFKLSVSDSTAFIFKCGSTPRYWDTSLPTYMYLEFYLSRAEAEAGSNLYGSAAVEYATVCASMAADATSAAVWDEETYGSVPAMVGDYESWIYLDYGAQMTVVSAGAVYPGTVDVNDLQYATVMVVSGSGSSATAVAIASSYDYASFDASEFLASLQVSDLFGNVLAAGTDYTAALEREYELGSATLVLTGCGSYSGTFEKTFNVVISDFTAQDSYGRSFTYKVLTQPTATQKGTVALGGGTSAAYSGNVTAISSLNVPSEVVEGATGEGFAFDVVQVSAYAFSGFTSLKTLTLPTSVTAIGTRAFYGCTSLATINFSEGLLTIADYAFGECVSLTEVSFPVSLQKLGNTVAADYVTGSYAFANCTSLTKVNFGTKDAGGATTITTRSFDGCTALREIYFNGNVDTLSHCTFYNMSSIEVIGGFYGVQTIGQRAFYGCSGLCQIDDEDTGVVPLVYEQTIYIRAFDGCTSITGVRIAHKFTFNTTGFGGGSSTTGGYTFANTSLSSVEFVGEWTSIPNYLFAGANELVSLELPSTLTSIGTGAFYSCAGLEHITIPAGVTSVGGSAFRSCSSLVSVEFEGNGTQLSLGTQLFMYCTSLASISLPEGVTSIPSYCFSVCTALESVSLPSTLKSIGESAFGSYSTTTLQYTTVYNACIKLTSLNIPSSVRSIGESAFYGCINLAGTLDLSGLSELEATTFAYCESLEGVVISDSLTSIDSAVFYGCTKLQTVANAGSTGVNLPSSITSIGNNCFYGCSSIISSNLSCAIDTLPRGMFEGCSSLVSVELPQSVESLGVECFSGCAALTDVVLPDGLVELPTSTFEGCTKLAGLDLPSGLQTIGSAAFSGCTSLVSLVLPAGLTEIGTNAFYNCHRLAWLDCTALNAAALQVASGALNTNNADTYLIFVNQDVPASLSLDSGHLLVIESSDAYYSGAACTPVSIWLDGAAASESIYTITYYNNVNAGSARAVVAVGSFSVELSFEIFADDSFGDDQIGQIETQYFTGDAIEPGVEIEGCVQGVDYTIAYENNVNIGTAVATITMSDNLGGGIYQRSFTITVKKGAVYTSGTLKYKVTSAKVNGKGCVEVSKCTGGTTVTVADTISLGGVSFKVTAIAAGAFKNCKKLKNLKVGANVKSVGKKAFYGCTKLKVLMFSSKSLPTLGKKALGKTKKMTVGLRSVSKKATKKLRQAGLHKKSAVVKVKA